MGFTTEINNFRDNRWKAYSSPLVPDISQGCWDLWFFWFFWLFSMVFATFISQPFGFFGFFGYFQWFSLGLLLGCHHEAWTSPGPWETPGGLLQKFWRNPGDVLEKPWRSPEQALDQLLGPFPLYFLIKTNTKSIGNRPGSSWSHFLYISLSKLRANQPEICLEAPRVIYFRFPYQN